MAFEEERRRPKRAKRTSFCPSPRQRNAIPKRTRYSRNRMQILFQLLNLISHKPGSFERCTRECQSNGFWLRRPHRPINNKFNDTNRAPTKRRTIRYEMTGNSFIFSLLSSLVWLRLLQNPRSACTQPEHRAHISLERRSSVVYLWCARVCA